MTGIERAINAQTPDDLSRSCTTRLCVRTTWFLSACFSKLSISWPSTTETPQIEIRNCSIKQLFRTISSSLSEPLPSVINQLIAEYAVDKPVKATLPLTIELRYDESFEVKVSPTDTLATLKRLVYNRTGHRPDTQVFFVRVKKEGEQGEGQQRRIEADTQDLLELSELNLKPNDIMYLTRPCKCRPACKSNRV